MKNCLVLIISCIFMPLLMSANAAGKLPRIAIAGLSIESSTFSPALTNEEAFHAKYGTCGIHTLSFFIC